MGSSAHVVVVHEDRAEAERFVERARRRIDELEARWSRFQPASELTRLNARRGVPVRVSRDTFELVAYAMRAYGATGGRYDPSVADALVALGYDRDFASIDRGTGARAAANAGCAPTPTPSNELVGLLLDPYVPAVTLPRGAGIDPGGIGKGLAGDMVVGELLVAGARGALVNIGGDVVARGHPPDEHGWIVGIAEPQRPGAPGDAGAHIARVVVESAGVCTSSPLTRSWRARDGTAVHDLLDPRSRRPLRTLLAAITVVAGEGWWAEALTKALFVEAADAEGDAGDRDAVMARMSELVGDEHVLAMFADGAVGVLGDPGAFDLESDRPAAVRAGAAR